MRKFDCDCCNKEVLVDDDFKADDSGSCPGCIDAYHAEMFRMYGNGAPRDITEDELVDAKGYSRHQAEAYMENVVRK